VLSESVSEDVAIAALLHDAPEDGGGRRVLDRIRKLFGDRVAEIVDACTDTYESPKPPWIERKEAYLARLRRTEDVDILVVKCADCLSNVRATLRDHRLAGDTVWDRLNAHSCAPQPCFGELDHAVSALLSETRPSEAIDHVHLAMPGVAGAAAG
jgi:(p)ppGpp synthase/HD superfamily hydrolase